MRAGGPVGPVRVFDLEQPRTAGMPIHPAHQQAGYSYLLHRHHEDEYRPGEAGPRTGAAGIIICGEHTGTHIDALCHQSDALTLYGGVRVDGSVQTSRGFKKHGVEEIPPILAPGVLLDVAASKGVESLEPGYAVTDADLEGCCERHGVSVEPGSVALVRTGNDRFWEDVERYLAGPGMAASASYWIAEKHVFAVGADNMAWDVPGLRDPELGCLLPGHLILLSRRGIYIIENLALEELSAAEAYRFDFVCTPLKFVGATGSPVRPLALVSGSIGSDLGEEEDIEIPKAMIVERIRSRSGAEKANQADNELPDKVDSENDVELLRKYDVDPDELRDEFRGQSPTAG